MTTGVLPPIATHVRGASEWITSVHVALGVLRAGDPDVRRVLWHVGADADGLRADLEGRGRRTA